MNSKHVDLSKPKRKYYNDEYDLAICPECGSDLVNGSSTILLSVKSDSDEGSFMTNLSGSHFCNKCPVVVFDKDKVEQAAIVGIKGGNNLKYMIAGFIDLDSIPDNKKHLEIGSDENPMPLVQFLPDLKKQTSIVSKPGRNELCVCGSGKKYKKCCGN
jgi:SEC-C motif